jgi:hypothetical protein
MPIFERGSFLAECRSHASPYACTLQVSYIRYSSMRSVFSGCDIMYSGIYRRSGGTCSVRH